MSEFKGYKKGYTEQDFKRDKQTVRELGRYDWDKADYRYAEQARQYKEALRRCQKQTKFNQENGIEVDASRDASKNSLNTSVRDVKEAVYDYVHEQIDNAMFQLMETAISCNEVSQHVPGYDIDWCAPELTPAALSWLMDAKDRMTKVCTKLLMWDASDKTE